MSGRFTTRRNAAFEPAPPAEAPPPQAAGVAKKFKLSWAR